MALLLALGEVAAGASGTRPGTLWCDEVFDSLDTQGCEAVSEAIQEMSRDRCVVVISHNPRLVEMLPDARRLHVESGKVSVL